MNAMDPIRVFVSHSSNDKQFVEQLLDELRTPEMAFFYDKYSIRSGEVVPEKIEEALADCDFFVCILTPEAVRSQWVTAERSAAVMRTLSADSRPVILPILLRDCDIPSLMKPYLYIDFRKQDQFEVAIAELRDRLGLDQVGDDNPILDEELFRMPAQKRRNVFGTLLGERGTSLNADRELISDARVEGILELYRSANYDFQPGRSLLNARIAAHHFASDLIRTHRKAISPGSASPFVISICGFPGLGKTTFARELRLTLIRACKVECTIVEFEKWMKDRSARWDGPRNVISGFDPEAFHYDELVAAIHSLVGGNPVDQPLRVEGNRVAASRHLKPADVLILDGVLSFADEFHRLTHWNVYFDADLAARYFLSGIKDYFVRSYDTSRRESKFTVHEQTYPKLIQSLRGRADCILLVSPYHNYRYYPLVDHEPNTILPRRARRAAR